jgi:hypothetical chaperone protein
MLERVSPMALDPVGVAAFSHFVRSDLGLRLHEAVRALKTALSQRPFATFEFDCGPVRIARDVTRAQFEDWIRPELTAIAASVDRLLTATGVNTAAINHVFLTGGSAFVPAVRHLFAERFGAQKIAGGDEFTSVATGLALRAARSDLA